MEKESPSPTVCSRAFFQQVILWFHEMSQLELKICRESQIGAYLGKYAIAGACHVASLSNFWNVFHYSDTLCALASVWSAAGARDELMHAHAFRMCGFVVKNYKNV